MKRFEQWITEGPLANEPMTERERLIAHIAYNEGAVNAGEAHIEDLDALRRSVGALEMEARAA